MGTFRYSDWLEKVSLNEFNPNNVNLNVKLVTDEYVPDQSHSPADVDKYIINGVSTIVENYFSANSMANIIDRVKEKMVLGFQTFPAEISAEIARVFPGDYYKEKREKLQQLIMMPEARQQLWRELKENGIGYFVFESPEHGILCFCESVEM